MESWRNNKILCEILSIIIMCDIVCACVNHNNIIIILCLGYSHNTSFKVVSLHVIQQCKNTSTGGIIPLSREI